MYCYKCGTKLEDDAIFCQECGAKQIDVQETSNMTNDSSAETKVDKTSDNHNSIIEKLKKNKMIVGIVLAVLVIVIGVLVMIGTRKPSVKLNDYVTITVEGCDPNGTASIDFDKDRFEADYGELLEKKVKKADDPSPYVSDEEKLEAILESLDDGAAYNKFLRDCVDGDFDKDSNLKHGDVITFQWDCDDEYALKTYGVKLKYSDIEYKVENLDKYVTSEDELTDDALKELQDKARKDYEEYEEYNLSQGGQIKSFEYIGMGSAVNNSGSSIYNNSMLCLAFKIDIQNTYTNVLATYDEPTTLYWCECFNDVTVNSKGENSYDLNNVTYMYDEVTIDSGISQGIFSTKEWNYYGYKSVEDMINSFQLSYGSSYDINFDTKALATGKGAPVNASNDNQADKNAGIIFANSSETIISAEEIKALTDEQLRYAINEIYARHGYIFKDNALLEYYKKFDWYKPEIASDAFTMEMLNETERTNVEAMQAERESRK